MSKDNQQEKSMRERLVCMPWYMKTATEMADFIEKETALTRKQAIQDCIECVEKQENWKQWTNAGFGGKHTEMKAVDMDKTLQALSANH